MTERLCPHCDQPLRNDQAAYLCPDGVTDLRDLVAGLSDLVDDVNLTITRQTATGDRNGGRSSAEVVIAWDDRASKTLASALSGLVSWAKSTLPGLARQVALLEHQLASPNIDDPALATHVAAVRKRLDRVRAYIAHLTGPRWVITGSHRLVVEILLDQLGHLTRRPEIGAFRDYVLRTRAQLLAASDTPAPRLYLGTCLADPLKHGMKCPEEIYAVDHTTEGQDHLCDRCRTTRCHTCGTEHDVRQRRAWLREAMDDRLATAGDIARGLATTTGVSVTKDQINWWVSSGRLLRHGTDRGAAIYRVGDVIDLATEETRRRAKKGHSA